MDEIQKTPEILASLRYFYEQMPNLAIICAGSLLDLALTTINFSMPVGRIEYLFLGPMSFQEFLLALGKKKLVEFIKDYKLTDILPITIHTQLLELLKIYLIVGGLPEAVKIYTVNLDILEAKQIHTTLIYAYKDDFSKYATKVTHTNSNGLPLEAEINNKHFKTFFLDIGLVSSVLDLNVLSFPNDKDFTLVNSGKIAEQYIAQHLIDFRNLYEKPNLYYWQREQKGASAEIDFIIAFNGKIIPVEIKAGTSGSLKSLHCFLQEKRTDLGVKFSSQLPSIT